MPIDIMMPALSPTMEKGTLARWLVGIGDRIKAGDLLAEIETDKATMEMEAADDGVVAELVVSEGSEDVAVGTVIARVASEDEAAPEAAREAAPPATPQLAAEARPQEPAPGVAEPLQLATDAVRATPLARRLAAARGVDLSAIRGTGAGGRIVRSDVIGPDLPPPAAIAAAPSVEAFAPPPVGVPHQAIRLSGMRRTIARRLAESKRAVPHFYLSVHCNLDPLLKLRASLNGDLAASGIRLSVNDLLIKALAGALMAVPDANVQFGGDTMYRFERVDVSMAVAVPGGLVTPVIHDAGAKSLTRIAAEARDLAARAREGALAPEAYQGGTVSISNLGMFGISEMVPVINLPQAMILGVAAGEQRPFVVDGVVSVATVMTATASFDHRAIDGAIGAEVLAQFRKLVEAPLTIIA